MTEILKMIREELDKTFFVLLGHQRGPEVPREDRPHSKKRYTRGGRERSHFFISQMDDYVKHSAKLPHL